MKPGSAVCGKGGGVSVGAPSAARRARYISSRHGAVRQRTSGSTSSPSWAPHTASAARRATTAARPGRRHGPCPANAAGRPRTHRRARRPASAVADRSRSTARSAPPPSGNRSSPARRGPASSRAHAAAKTRTNGNRRITFLSPWERRPRLRATREQGCGRNPDTSTARLRHSASRTPGRCPGRRSSSSASNATSRHAPRLALLRRAMWFSRA